MGDKMEFIEKSLSEWKVVLREYSQPNSDTTITEVFTCAYNLAVIITELQQQLEIITPDRKLTKELGALIPCHTGGTFENDPSDAIIDAAIGYGKSLQEQLEAEQWKPKGAAATDKLVEQIIHRYDMLVIKKNKENPSRHTLDKARIEVQAMKSVLAHFKLITPPEESK